MHCMFCCKPKYIGPEFQNEINLHIDSKMVYLVFSFSEITKTVQSVFWFTRKYTR